MTSEQHMWAKAYSDDGFVIVPDLLSAAALDQLREAMDRILNYPNGVPSHLRNRILFERTHVEKYPDWYANELTPEACGDAIREITDLPLFDRVFAELICHRKMLDVLETLFKSTEFSLTMVAGKPKAARVGNGAINGKLHRDSPFDLDAFTSINNIMSFVCLDDMVPENGSTTFVRGSHQLSDEESCRPEWKTLEFSQVEGQELIRVNCPRGSGVFFTSKVIHAAGHNRSSLARRTIYIGWVGPGVLPVFPARFAYQGVKPRSVDPAYRKQIRMAFPGLFDAEDEAVVQNRLDEEKMRE